MEGDKQGARCVSTDTKGRSRTYPMPEAERARQEVARRVREESMANESLREIQKTRPTGAANGRGCTSKLAAVPARVPLCAPWLRVRAWALRRLQKALQPRRAARLLRAKIHDPSAPSTC
eukprot:6203597-Pleurochrysis_carterae.AAC.5